MSQTQTPAAVHQSDDATIDYTPGSAVYAGDIVVVGGLPLFIPHDIPASTLGAGMVEGIFKLPKTTDVFAIGDPVNWNATADPVTGTAGTGAGQAASGVFFGVAVAAALTGDSYVYVRMTAWDKLAGKGSVKAVTAAGSVQGDAAALAYGLNAVTGADATKGVILPTAVPGMTVEIKNVTAAVLKIYPATGGAINAVAANGAYSIAASTSVILKAYSATQWYSFPLVAS